MKRHPLLWFWLLGFLLSWAAWVPLAMAVAGRLSLPLSPAQIQAYGAYGPALAALLITWVIGGLDGIQSLFSRLFIWRVGWRWYLVALLLPAGISLLAAILNLMRGGEPPDLSQPPITRFTLPTFYGDWSPWAMILPVFVQNVLFGTVLGEELGWRGFGLQRLQERVGALKASLVIAILWVLWGLPLSWTQLESEARAGFYATLLLGAIPASVLITWIYNSTRGSLLLVLLFNTATKVTDLFVTPSQGPPLVPVIAYWLVMLGVLSTVGLRGLEPKPAQVVTAPEPLEGTPNLA